MYRNRIRPLQWSAGAIAMSLEEYHDGKEWMEVRVFMEVDTLISIEKHANEASRSTS